ncbi:ImmA/IrrE family metallo-endopeptidase [Paenibacillus sp. CMAA1364]
MIDPMSSSVAIPDYVKLQIELESEQFAQEVRNRMNSPLDQPLEILSVIEKQFQIYVLQIMDLNTSGFVRVFGKHKVIFLNGSESLGRQYYTAAHELCHTLRDLGRIKEIELMSEHDKEIELKKMEYFAYGFADHFLTPRAAVVRYCTDNKWDSFSAIKPFDVIKFQYHFRISYRQAVRMLQKVGVINDEQRELLAAFSSKENPNQIIDLTRESGYSTELSLPLKESHIPSEFYSSILDNIANAYISPRKAAYLEELLHIRLPSFGSKDGLKE